jgi:hypothetical protein
MSSNVPFLQVARPLRGTGFQSPFGESLRPLLDETSVLPPRHGIPGMAQDGAEWRRFSISPDMPGQHKPRRFTLKLALSNPRAAACCSGDHRQPPIPEDTTARLAPLFCIICNMCLNIIVHSPLFPRDLQIPLRDKTVIQPVPRLTCVSPGSVSVAPRTASARFRRVLPGCSGRGHELGVFWVCACCRSVSASIRISFPSLTTTIWVPLCMASLRARSDARRSAARADRRSGSFALEMSCLFIASRSTPSGSGLRPRYHTRRSTGPCSLSSTANW